MPNRRYRSLRLSQYDYKQAGMYFVTVCSHQRACLFGEITDGVMCSNALGQCVEISWRDLPLHYSHIGLDVFIVMPNHIHGIIALPDDADLSASPERAGLRPAPTGADDTLAVARDECVGAGLRPARSAVPTTNDECVTERRHALSEIVRAFKSFSARQINALRGVAGVPVWQRGYYEHVIRNEHELSCIREYTENNPLQWSLDRENPQACTRAGLRPAPTDDLCKIFGGILP